MLNLNTYNDNWTQGINCAVDMFMKILDWMWSLKLPGTDIPLYTIWLITFILGIVMLLLGSNLSLAPMAKLTRSSLSTMYNKASSQTVRKGNNSNSHNSSRKNSNNKE